MKKPFEQAKDDAKAIANMLELTGMPTARGLLAMLVLGISATAVLAKNEKDLEEGRKLWESVANTIWDSVSDIIQEDFKCN